MKRFMQYATGLCLVIGLMIYFFSSNDFEKMPKMQRIDKAIEQEFEKTVDPKLGEVPRERLMRAKAYKEDLMNNQPEGAIANITWSERGPDNVSGRTRALLIDAADGTKNTLYAGSVGGGLWKTTNSKATTPSWTPVNDLFGNLAISSIIQDPSNNQIIYFGTGEGFFNADAIRGLGIWKSTDGGTTWNQLSSTNNSTFHYVQKLTIADDGSLLACTRNGGVQRSTNGGTSWTKVLGSGASATTNRAADIEKASNGDLFASMGLFSTDGIYKSTDHGVSWTKQTSGLPSTGYHRIELACAPSDSMSVYALYQGTNYNCSGIYKTEDGGSSWSSKTVPGAYGMSNFCRGQAWYDMICAVDPNDDTRVFIGGIDVLVSSNSGTSWSQITQWYGGGGYQYMHADQHAMLFEEGNSSVLYFGNDGGVYRTEDATAGTPNVDGIYDGYNVTQFYACGIHPSANTNTYLAGSQDNGTQYFTAAGINSTNEVTGGDGAFVHIDQTNANTQISSYVYNQYRVTTNGWGSYVNVNISSSAGRFINPTDYDNDENILYGAYSGGSYSYVSDVGGSNTKGSRSIAAFNGATVSYVFADPNTTNRVWFGLSGSTNLVMVDDAHISASTAVNRSVPGVSGYLSSIDVEDGNADHIIVCFSNYGINSVWESTDGGLNWTSVEGNLPDMPIRSVIFAPGDATRALVGTELGVWSTDLLSGGATNWGATNGGLANVRVDQLQYRSSDNEMIAATHGRGLYSAVFPDNGVQVTITSSNDVSCNGGSDGDATADGSNGVAPYSYAWSNGANTATATNLSAGAYTVTVTDANSNTGTANVSIGEPTILTSSGTTTDETGVGNNDGAIDLSVSGGTSPYTYLWSNGATTQDITGLSAGDYDVTVTDNNGCTTTNGFTINTSVEITFSTSIQSGSDDAEEDKKGTMRVSDSNLEIVKLSNQTGNQRIGLRFAGVVVPQGANIIDAHIQFTCSNTTNTSGGKTIYGQDVNSASTFTSSKNNIRNRTLTSASVGWSPSNWNTLGASGAAQQTPNLASVVQEIVDRTGWVDGNAMAFIIQGSGRRNAAAFENGSYAAAELTITYSAAGMSNIAPTVDITSPADGTTYTTLQSINIDADASDPDGSITQVEFLVDGVTVGTDATSPYSTSWTPGAFGTYELTAVATDDSAATTTSSIVEVIFSDNVPVNVSAQIGSSSDDAEEDKRNRMTLTDAVLELVKPSNKIGNQKIGLRFTGLNIPQGSTIQSAHIEFTAASSTNSNGGKTIYGHDVDNSSTFTSSNGNITNRSLTSASTSWSPANWTSGNTYNTSDIANVVQEIVDRGGYSASSAISIIVQGSGRRDAHSYDGSAADAPILHVTYVAPPSSNLDDEVKRESITVELYPNPSQDYINIRLDNVTNSEFYRTRIYNIEGQVVFESNIIDPDLKEVTLLTSEYRQGTYVVEVVNSNNKRVAIQRFIKL